MRNKSVKSKRGTDLYSVGKAMQEGVMSAMRTAIPGIIQSFDGKTQTAVIQPAIRRRVAGADGGEVVQVQEPLLLDVPVMFLGGGVSSLTFPVAEGDECLVIFADTNIDAWYQSGGVQNQVYPRSHSVADGFAIVGFRSRPKAIGEVACDMPVIDNLRVSGKLFAQIEGRIDRATDADNADKLGGFPASDYAFDSDVEALGTSLTYSMNDGFSTLTNWANNTFSVLGHDHEWSEIQSKPVVFPPSEHGHPWSAISEKPSTYPATAHGHVWGDLSNVPSIFPTDWDNVANKPSTFPATAHDHEWSEIQSKPATFPPSSHNQAWSTITGAPTSFPASDVSAWAKAATKPSYTHTEVGAAASAHDHIQLYARTDNRSVATTPNDYNSYFTVAGLKQSSTVGTPMTGTYVGIIGWRQWSDSSGGPATELAFGDEGIAFRQGATTSWGGWNRLIHSGNYTNYTVTKTGTGASGTWGISITGNAATATTASDSSKLGGLSLGNATQGSHPGANVVVRTDANGYLNVGWINTVSGTATGTPTRIYCSQDAYLRYYAPDNATLRRSMKAYITYGTGDPSGGVDGDIYLKHLA